MAAEARQIRTVHVVLVLLAISLVTNIAFAYTRVQLENELSRTDAAARNLSKQAATYLQKIGADCSADPTNYRAVEACFSRLIDDMGSTPDITFRLYDEEDMVIALRNGGARTLNGSQFRLYHGEEVVDGDGCTQDAITPDGLCVLEFDASWLNCQIGTQMRATYAGETVYTRNCLG